MRSNETTLLQCCLVLFVVTGSVGVLLLVGQITSDEVCDYNDVIESCADPYPTYVSPTQLNASLKQFGTDWLFMAQEMRMEAEKAKCAIEDRLMADLRKLHRREAEKIIEKCRQAFSECAYPSSTGTTTTLVSTTSGKSTTLFRAGTTVTTTIGNGCLRQVIASGTDGTPATATFVDCVTDPGNEGPYPPLPTTTTTATAHYDCSTCDMFCRAFNWSQLDPNYAQIMQYSQSQPCSDTVCPWPTMCTNGAPSPAIHPNCSAKGCPCFRASCLHTTTTTTTTTTTIAAGGRRLRDLRWQAELERMKAEAGSTRHLQGAIGRLYNDGTSSLTCMCKPGHVATVMVGRPYRVFYGDVPSQMAQAGLGNGRLLHSAGRRKLNDPYYEAQLMQGVDITMEEEHALNFEKSFDCRTNFSDRFRYVYPKSVGPPDSIEAFQARQNHADLGCGYSGTFKVTCIENATAAALGENGCNYKVDISTCVPPSYQAAVDSCWVKEPPKTAPIVQLPPQQVLDDWMEIEDINDTENVTEEEWKMPAAPAEKCCTLHVSSECVPTREFPDYGTINGSWIPERSYRRETPYFQSISCSQQAQPKHHACPQVRVTRLPGWHHADDFPQCFDVCDLTSVNEELNQTCNSTVEEVTKILQDTALQAKVAAMQAHKDMLRAWSRDNWPKPVETKHVLDCVMDDLPRSYNRLGYPKRRNDGFDQLKLRYECRIHGCKAKQCLKVMEPCHIDHMDSALENTCGPLGDQKTYQCIDKVEIFSTGFSWMVAYGFFGLAFCCLASMFGICIRSFTRRNAKVAPVLPMDSGMHFDSARGSLAITDVVQACKYCGEDFEPGEQYCRRCSLPGQAPPQAGRCPLCEIVYQPGDTNCMKCGAARATAPQLELIDREFKCLACGHMNDPTDMFCSECGAKRNSPTPQLTLLASEQRKVVQKQKSQMSVADADQKRQATQGFVAGGRVKVWNSMQSDSVERVELPEDTLGSIVEIDAAFDLCIKFDGFEKGEWVFAENCGNLSNEIMTPTTVSVSPLRGKTGDPDPMSPSQQQVDMDSAQRNPMRALAGLSNSPSNQNRIQPFNEGGSAPLRGLE